MRQTKIHKWDSPLKLFEREHLIEEGIRSKKELIDNIEYMSKFTTPCKECQKILNKLGR